MWKLAVTCTGGLSDGANVWTMSLVTRVALEKKLVMYPREELHKPFKSNSVCRHFHH